MICEIFPVTDSRPAFNDKQSYLTMSAPDDDTSNHAGGIMNGHGVGIALVAIFVG
jgi:hypothetical protein